jgi:guanine deaminase
MEQAWHEARKGINSGDGGPFGAVIVKGGQVVAAAHNLVLKTHDVTAHAEISVIRRANEILENHDLSGCEIYTTCYPCPMCLGAILWARIRKVYYGCNPDQAAAIGFNDKAFYEAVQNPECNDMVSLINAESEACLTLFQEWLDLEGHQLY